MMLPFQRILCPIDFSDFSYQALDKAGELAAHFGAQLCVLHVAPPVETAYDLDPNLGSIPWHVADHQEGVTEGARKKLEEIIEHKHFGIEVRPLLLEGNAADQIVSAAGMENSDLVVISTHGQGGWRHLVFGSVAEKVIRLAPCPVLVTRAQKS